MGSAAELLRAYGRAGSWEEAEAVLDALARAPAAAEAGVGDLFDELASAAADAGEPGRAARLEAKALASGCEQPRLARQMLGWYLLEDGQRVAGEAEFAALLADGAGDEVDVLLALGAARVSAGHHEEGLAALDRALAAAHARGAPSELRRARAERRDAREALGLAPDVEDAVAPPRASELLAAALPRALRPQPRPGRNDPCLCGSGRKFKRCCGA